MYNAAVTSTCVITCGYNSNNIENDSKSNINNI